MSNEVQGVRLSPEQRRQQIVDVAGEQFARHGVAGASMSAIARDAGVTRALVYHYFPGKESLLEAVLRQEADRLLAATAPNAGVPPRENVERALNAYFDHFAASAGGVRELYTASASSSVPVTQLAAANHAVQIDRLLAGTETADTPANRLAFGAWLAFVEFAARHLEETTGGVEREQALRLCLSALESVIGRSLRP